MTHVRFQLVLVVLTMLGFLAMLALNEWLFSRFQYAPGINWVYLPAGMRLLATLLFGGAGAVGLLLVSWLVSFVYFFPDDPLRAFAGGILATAAPYLVYRLARGAYGLQASLANLSPGRLFACIIAYALASPLLHHLWFYWQGQDELLASFAAMAIGDFTGSLIVIYAMKGALAVADRMRAQRSSGT